MQVLEVVVADQPRALVETAHALVSWFNVAALDQFEQPDDIAALTAAATCLRDTWQIHFDDTGVHALRRICKLHRLDHVAASVEMYGRYRSLTTELSESAHKQLKNLFRTYVEHTLFSFPPPLPS